jgi:GNAT superfamily N-acetyltransferase
MLKIAKAKDIEFLRQIRNDNRKFFLDEHLIGVDEHNIWCAEHLKKDLIFIIYSKQQRVGTVSLICDDTTAILGRFVIEEAYRGRGLGSKAVDEFISICNSWGFAKVSLEVKKGNLMAKKFYLQRGFNVIKETEKGIIMEISL